MDIYVKAFASVGILVTVILVTMFLRHLNIIKSEQAPIFSKLVTHVTLPALIFHSLSQATLHWEYVLLALIMLGAELLSLLIAWKVGNALRLTRPQQGSFMLVSGFGSSALLGYALIEQIFPGNINAMTEAVVITELGVGPALFTLGTMIALYYGSAEVDTQGRIKAVLSFFKSPICFSVVTGIVWALSGIPVTGMVLTPFFKCFEILASANTFLVALTVGVILRFSGIRTVAVMAACVCLIKLVLKPILVWGPTNFLSLQEWQVQILVLEAAMPSALLTVVLANTYGCDAKLASKLVFATTVVSMATLILMFRLLV
jgi:malate permease and related proteins